ncbi:hypothetical protein GOP56_18420 [Brevibacillus sp. 7WMA2]|uniref:hypothetical protein n=1 Tax=Brevibacillus TaxID=55080 RepID=UPI00111027EF|nr:MULTISPECIES: hypothetical protein [Brevibacillus]MBA4533351.1 hypothetical protein [Brevibacillus halotolerans]MCR8963887.1 hypothetical protein [Brevibacillus laterosporus]MCR8997339.1 hypothetical protein [Brevibacillus laterosporus]MCZ0836042.1 hypothetical protein [Brevibacillus halotolerans]MDF9412430.1 hypothetical protein [Brevibacillus laterosporus]
MRTVNSFWRFIASYFVATLIWVLMWNNAEGMVPSIQVAWFTIGVVVGSLLIMNVKNSSPRNQQILYLLLGWLSIYATIHLFEWKVKMITMAF